MKLLDNVTRKHLQVTITNCSLKSTKTSVGEKESIIQSLFPKGVETDVLTPDSIMK